MGTRFHKSVSLGKGLRVNVSKKGLGLSVGGRGHSVSFGPSGSYLNLSIPGTGISYREKIGGAGRTPRKQAASKEYSGTLQIVMDEDGKFSYKDKNGNPITDASQVRQLNANPQVKETKERLKEQHVREQREEADRLNAARDEFVDIAKLSPHVMTEAEYADAIANLRPVTYQRRAYEAREPRREDFEERAAAEAKDAVRGVFKKKERKRFAENRVEALWRDAERRWSDDRAAFEAGEDKRETSENLRLLKEHDELVAHYRESLEGDENAVEDEVRRAASSITLPVDISVDYDLELPVLWVDLDLPEIEDMPSTEFTVLASGKIKEKARKKSSVQEDYAKCVAGVTIFVAAVLFNASPCIEEIVVSGYTQRRDKEGNLVDDYVVSVRYARGKFESSAFPPSDAERFLLGFENRCNPTKTKILKAIKPYTPDEA